MSFRYRPRACPPPVGMAGFRAPTRGAPTRCAKMLVKVDCKLFAMIYLDHNAIIPILPEVPEATMPYVTTEWGNP